MPLTPYVAHLLAGLPKLCEWLDIPGGTSAQIQGHAPQGVREQNYIRRPLDLLRVHHENIEAWMLEQAGIPFDAKAASAAAGAGAGALAWWPAEHRRKCDVCPACCCSA